MPGTTEAPPRAMVRGPDEGEAVWFLNNRMLVKASSEETGGAYGLVESWVGVGQGPPLHVHHREEEAFWVLSGRLRIRCGEDEYVAEAGAYALLPREVPHAFQVEGDEPAHLLTLISPGGGERFFVRAGRPAEGPGLPPPAPPDIPALQRAAAEFGDEILGPPLGAR